MTDFLKIAKSIVVHFAHICAYGVETVKFLHAYKNCILKLLCSTSPDFSHCISSAKKVHSNVSKR